MINILIPTDFSPNAQVATDYAIGQFTHSKVQFTLYHAVIQPRSYSGMLVNITDIMLNDARDLLNQEITRIKEKFGDGVHLTSATRVGHLEDVINTVIRKNNIDLVVMGTKGESDVASKVLGSNAEHIIRKSEKPVLTIPNSSTVEQLSEILIATDQSELPNAQELQTLLSALVNQVSISALTVLTSDTDKAPKSIELSGHQLPVHAENAPKAMEGIENYLHANNVDMLVVYHHHKARLDYLFSRSITKKVAGNVAIPLLVIPG
ncbi:MAG: universal stress protein [Flavobacteriales bacterium]|nr:universal stress protein [Bacteroidota bacterium]MCB9240442.1 universal stress protein [Flavobacteriales bacterium]